MLLNTVHTNSHFLDSSFTVETCKKNGLFFTEILIQPAAVKRSPCILPIREECLPFLESLFTVEVCKKNIFLKNSREHAVSI